MGRWLPQCWIGIVERAGQVAVETWLTNVVEDMAELLADLKERVVQLLVRSIELEESGKLGVKERPERGLEVRKRICELPGLSRPAYMTRGGRRAPSRPEHWRGCASAWLFSVQLPDDRRLPHRLSVHRCCQWLFHGSHGL